MMTSMLTTLWLFYKSAEIINFLCSSIHIRMWCKDNSSYKLTLVVEVFGGVGCTLMDSVRRWI